jgi:hypothetical protein
MNYNIQAQIKALEIILMSGKCQNKYAIQNKIKALKRKVSGNKKNVAWSNFLAQ